MRSMAQMLILALAACAGPAGQQAGAPAGAPARADDPEAIYRAQMLGRWGDTTACDGWVWDFGERSLTGPGAMDAPNGISCSVVRTVPGAPAGAARIVATGCRRDMYMHGDIVMDMARDADMLTLTALYDHITPAQWFRCPR